MPIYNLIPSLKTLLLLPLAPLTAQTETHLVQPAQVTIQLPPLHIQTLQTTAQLLQDARVLQLLLQSVLSPADAHLFREIEHSHKLKQVAIEMTLLVPLPVELGSHEFSEGTFESVQQLIATIDKDTVVLL